MAKAEIHFGLKPMLAILFSPCPKGQGNSKHIGYSFFSLPERVISIFCFWVIINQKREDYNYSKLLALKKARGK